MAAVNTDELPTNIYKPYASPEIGHSLMQKVDSFTFLRRRLLTTIRHLELLV